MSAQARHGFSHDKAPFRLLPVALTCAVLVGGAVRCWGNNFYGELGNGTAITSLMSVMVVSVTDATIVSAGNSHTCAVLSTGSVRCSDDLPR